MHASSTSSDTAATVQFLGGADSVTGSRHLVSTPRSRVLVDCGLFQGFKVLRDRNRARFPVAPGSIDAVVLTHAHLDHSGYVPALVRDGFRGPIYASEGTVELCRIMLMDSAHLLDEEARHASRHAFSKHAHPRPLYTTADAARALEQFRVLEEDKRHRVADGVDVRLVPAGHILGAMGVRVSAGGRLVHFTGDLGRAQDPLMRPPHPLEQADVLVAESTYGDRGHPDEDPEAILGDLIRRVAGRGGVVLIPAFAVGRTETILLHLSRLRDRRQIPDVPVFLNSPMAVAVTDVYRRHRSEHRLDPAELERMYALATPVRSVDESKLLNLRGGPMVIISASGMLTGGRILHHVLAYGADRRNAIVLTGFQAGGTRGSALLAGARSLRIFGADVPIAAEVLSIDSMSAHADADELVDWMRLAEPPRQVFLVHGEPAATDALRARISRELGWRVRVPEHQETVALDDLDDLGASVSSGLD